MAQFASDAFAGIGGTNLTTHNADWTLHTSYTVACVLTSAARCRADATGLSMYYHAGVPASADYSVSADLYYQELDGGAGTVGVMGRIDTAANTGYSARYSGGSADSFQLSRIVSGTFTTFGGSAATVSAGTTHNGELRMVGSTIEFYLDGGATALLSATDTSITAAGKAGIRLVNSAGDTVGIHLDNFSADDVASGGPTLVTASDSLTPSFTEALALLSASDLSDTVTPGVSESVGLAVLVNASDTLTPSVTETANVIAAVITSDTLTPSLVEAQASFVTSALSEAFTLSLGEVQGSLLTSAVTDVATISVSDSAAVLVALVGSDTYIVSITDSAAVVVADTIAKAVTESLTLSLTEVASIVTASLWTDKAVAVTVWTDKPDASTTWTVQ